MNDVKQYLSGLLPIDEYITLWDDYCNQDYWETKNNRLALINQLDKHKLFIDIITQVVLLAYEPMTLVNILCTIDYDGLNKQQSIQTNSELLWVIRDKGIFDWANIADKRYIQSKIELPDELMYRVKMSCLLPPMLVKPCKIKTNTDSAYLTIHKDSIILNDKRNMHNNELALDVINTLNQQALVLDDTAFLYESALDGKSKEQYEYFLGLLKDKQFHLTYKFDKRGRIYAQGYHFNTMGDSFSKACINLAVSETVQGEL